MVRKLFPVAAAVLLATSVAGAQPASGEDSGDIGSVFVQGNIYMLAGPDGNSAVSVGDWGVMVVDTQTAEYADQIIAKIREITKEPIRYVVDTSADPNKVGGNTPISRAGAPVTGGNLGRVAFENGATIIAHENVLFRMSGDASEGEAVEDPDALPTTTYFEGQKEVFFNEEPVIIKYFPAAHTDGDSIVFFRRSDVIAAGDIFDMTAYPHIDIERGGNVQGVLDGLNWILSQTIPRHEQEGGTYVIPGRGRLTDEHDVLEYRDMVTIVRDRIQAMIDQGMTLEQIQAAKPTYEYDPRFGSDSGDWTTKDFVAAVYQSLAG